MQLTISHNFPAVLAAMDTLGKDLGGKVATRAVNATLAQARTAMSQGIRQEFNLTAAKVREKLQVKRAVFRSGTLTIEGELYAKDRRGNFRSVNLINFAARVSKRGVLSVKVKKAGGRKPITGAFIGNKGRTVFERTAEAKRSGKRLPIRPVQTIDVPQMFNTRRINRKVVQLIEAKFPEVFEREARYALSQWAKVGR